MKFKKTILLILLLVLATVLTVTVAAEVVSLDTIAVSGVSSPVAGEILDYNFSIIPNKSLGDYDYFWGESDTEPASVNEILSGTAYFKNGNPTAKGGKYYSILLCFGTGVGWNVTPGTTVTIDGTPLKTSYNNDWGVLYAYKSYYVDYNHIETITLADVVAPVAGEKASFGVSFPDAKLPGGIHYGLYTTGYGNQYWTDALNRMPTGFEEIYAADWNGKSAELSFQAGKYYSCIFYIVEDEGAKFAQNLTATINGEPAKISYEDYESEGIICVYKTFYVEPKYYINNIAITDVVTPVLGEERELTYNIPFDAHYGVGESIGWKAYEYIPETIYDNYWWLDSGTFYAGYYHTFCCEIKEDDLSAFAKNLTATINGEPAAVEVADGRTYVYRAWYVPYIMIDRIDFNNVGVIPGFDDDEGTVELDTAAYMSAITIPANANYEFDTSTTERYFYNEAWDMMWTSDTLYSNDVYSAVLMLKPNEDYAFSPDLKVYVNGLRYTLAQVENSVSGIAVKLPLHGEPEQPLDLELVFGGINSLMSGEAILVDYMVLLNKDLDDIVDSIDKCINLYGDEYTALRLAPGYKYTIAIKISDSGRLFDTSRLTARLDNVKEPYTVRIERLKADTLMLYFDFKVGKAEYEIVRFKDNMAKLYIGENYYNDGWYSYHAKFAVAFADYEDGKLVDIRMVYKQLPMGYVDIAAPEGISLSSGDKILLWDSFETMNPMCEAYEIN